MLLKIVKCFVILQIESLFLLQKQIEKAEKDFFIRDLIFEKQF